jgi:flavin reductase (DIM6/NTAB) family NADH-FMN oxidoreductase RutF
MIIDPATTPRGELHSVIIRCLAPRPIAWVSTLSREGVPNLAPFSFFTGVSSDPPAVCFVASRHDDGRKKDTLVNIEATGQFVINFVTEELGEKMNVTATEYPHGISEFEKAGLTPTPATHVAPPMLKESPIHFECERYELLHVGADGLGGGTIVVGRVLLMHIDESILTNGKVDYERYHPIGRLGAMEYTRTRDRFTMVRKKYTPES